MTNTQIDPGAEELFRMVALRPPEPIRAMKAIRIDDYEADDDDPDVVADGELTDLEVDGLGQKGVAVLSFRKLNLAFRTNGDRLDSKEVQDKVSSLSGADLGQLVKRPEWDRFRRLVHTQLWALADPPEAPHSPYMEDAARGEVLLRGVRLLELLSDVALGAKITGDQVHDLLWLRPLKIEWPLHPSPLASLARPPYLADLKVVKTGSPRYRMSAIAHIENIMASEKRSRTHQWKTQRESVATTTTESGTEQIQDLATNTSSTLQIELTRKLEETVNAEAGARIGIYGPTVKIDADARIAHQGSREEASRSASSYANSIVQEAKSRVWRNVTESRTTREFFETLEVNLHEFENQGADPKHIVGIYRWVEQVQEAWIENYGRRLMLELVVPDPAAVLRWSASKVEIPDSVGPEPERPNIAPDDLTEDNYLQHAAPWGLEGLPKPPAASQTLGLTFRADAGEFTVGRKTWADHTVLKVPAGYRATAWTAWAATWGDSSANNGSWMVCVGSQSAESNDGLLRSATGTLDAPEGSTIPVAMQAVGILSLGSTVYVRCERTPAQLNEWRQRVHAEIIKAWQKAHDDWDNARRVEAAKQSGAEQFTAASAPMSPQAAVNAERQELRRCVLHMLLGNAPDKGQFSGQAAPVVDGRPSIDIAIAAAERDGILFMEEAFEWSNMSWIHYPYYWANDDWSERLAPGVDASWDAFLRAGASRVVVPVRPGFESTICFFLVTGRVWSGGQVPTVGHPAFLGISEEIADSMSSQTQPTDRYPLEPVVLPTNLVMLQPTSELNGTRTGRSRSEAPAAETELDREGQSAHGPSTTVSDRPA